MLLQRKNLQSFNASEQRTVTPHALSKAPKQIPRRQPLYQFPNEEIYIAFSLKLFHHRDRARELDHAQFHSLPFSLLELFSKADFRVQNLQKRFRCYL